MRGLRTNRAVEEGSKRSHGSRTQIANEKNGDARDFNVQGPGDESGLIFADLLPVEIGRAHV